MSALPRALNSFVQYCTQSIGQSWAKRKNKKRYSGKYKESEMKGKEGGWCDGVDVILDLVSFSLVGLCWIPWELVSLGWPEEVEKWQILSNIPGVVSDILHLNY